MVRAWKGEVGGEGGVREVGSVTWVARVVSVRWVARVVCMGQGGEGGVREVGARCPARLQDRPQPTCAARATLQQPGPRLTCCICLVCVSTRAAATAR